MTLARSLVARKRSHTLRNPTEASRFQCVNKFKLMDLNRENMTGSTIPDPDEIEGRITRTTVTSFRVIDALAGREEIGVSELAEELSLSKGTVHKHLTTLRKLRYVVRKDGKYRLSLGFLGLGTSVRARMKIYRVSHEPLEKLAEATGEVASIMVPEHGWGIYLSHVASETEISAERNEGRRVPLTATAGGKSILAYLPEEDRRRILDEHGLPRYTEHTITDRSTMREELQRVHDNRTARDRGEFELDRHCVASPVTNAEGTALAAVTVSGPADRMSEKAPTHDFPSIIGSTATSIENRVTE